MTTFTAAVLAHEPATTTVGLSWSATLGIAAALALGVFLGHRWATEAQRLERFTGHRPPAAQPKEDW